MTITIKKHLLILCLASLSSQLCLAQGLYFKNLNVENGLSQEDISSIVQDSFGFIWIGTFDGLNRFDGRTIETFNQQTANPASLPDNRISALAEDHKKRLWIGTQGGLFAYYSLLTEQFHRIKSPDYTGEILKIFQAENQSLYALTSIGVLKLNDGSEPEFELIPTSKNLHTRDAIQKTNDEIYFAGISGISILKNEKVTKLRNPDRTIFSSLARADKSIIAGGDDGLYIVDEINGVKKLDNIELPNAPINAMINDKDGNIWIGVENKGLFQLDKSLNLLSHYTASKTTSRGLLSNTILELYLDASNNLWVGSRQGLCYTNLSNTGFNSINLTDLYRPNVRSLLVNDQDLLLGITNEGLFRYDLQNGTLTDLKISDVNFVNHIEKIENKIYASTDRGLLSLSNDYSLESIHRIPNYPTNESANIRCVAKDAYDRIYVGTHKGILLKKGDKLNWIWDDYPELQVLNEYFIFRMFFDQNTNQLLVGTRSKGLVILSMDQNGEFLEVDTEGLLDINGNPISNTSVWSFHQSRDGSIWIGSDLGLFKRESNEVNFHQIDVAGVLDKKILSIAEDKNNNLWLSSTQGLTHFRAKMQKVKTYTFEDGLLSSSMTEASGYFEDKIFFGTTIGANYMDANGISLNPFDPELLLSNLKINNEAVKPSDELYGSIILSENINATDQLSLNHLQNNFSLDFSATNFSNNSKNNYRYRLGGYDSKWVYTVYNKVISYSNLDPGEYLLEIQVEDNEGNWTINPFALPIQIEPAFWKTTLAYVIYAFLIGAIAFAFLYFWLQKQRLNHQIELDHIKISQDKELRDKQLSFFVDVGHEFKTPLSLILAPFKDLMDETLSAEQKNICLQIVSRNIDRMNILVNQLLDLGRISEGQKFVKVKEQDLRLTIREYTKAFEWQIHHENIDLRLNLDKCTGYFDSSVLEKGFYNVLSNAFKYTPNSGVIDISLKEEQINGNVFAIINVSDSGSGIPDDQKSHIFERFYHGKDRASSGIGLHLAKSLIQAHGGSIIVEDSDLGGAKFKINLPISRNSYSDAEINISPVEQRKVSVVAGDSNSFNDEVVEKGETILIVEDDHELRNYLNISLQNDYSILQANNGEQGLSMAQENLPDIIISDVMMPIMDGIEMCEQLKINNDTSHIPILFLTAKRDIDDQNKGLKVGAWDYITKPFDSEALRRKVINILETRNRFKKYLLNHNTNIDIESHYTSYDQKLLQNINQVIIDNISNTNFTASELAKEVGLSRMHLHRKLKTLAGETAKIIITRAKMRYAVDMFDKGCDRVQEAMIAVGITNYGNFNNNFKSEMKMTASEYIEKRARKTDEGD